jgi:hypothetical protein
MVTACLILVLANSAGLVWIGLIVTKLIHKLNEVRSYVYLKAWAKAIEEGEAPEELDELKRKLYDHWKRKKDDTQ